MGVPFKRKSSCDITAFLEGLLIAALLLLPISMRAESISRSDPQTAGEKRLLEWDLNKSYDLSRSRTTPLGKAPSRSFTPQSFRTAALATKPFSAETFFSSEFLAPRSKTQTSPFPVRGPVSVDSSELAKPFVPSKASPIPKAVPTFPTEGGVSPKSFEGTRTYRGVEAVRKDQKYLPENAPKGGVIEGKRLTIDEVKEILNKSK